MASSAIEWTDEVWNPVTGCSRVVNSMSDLFHEEVPFEFIAAVFGVMAVADEHTFQILTKRPETPAAVRFVSAEPLLGPLVARGWMTSATNATPDGSWTAATKVYYWDDGYSGPGVSLTGIDWLVVGGESGAVRRPIREEWVRDLRAAAGAAGTAFFLKQWGGLRPGGEALLDGVAHREFPRPARASA